MKNIKDKESEIKIGSIHWVMISSNPTIDLHSELYNKLLPAIYNGDEEWSTLIWGYDSTMYVEFIGDEVIIPDINSNLKLIYTHKDIEYWAEEYECLTKYLDDKEVPKVDKEKNDYSIIGRVENYVTSRINVSNNLDEILRRKIKYLKLLLFQYDAVIFKNVKNDNEYLILSVNIDSTNSRNGNVVIQYKEILEIEDNFDDQEIYIRDANEFFIKFKYSGCFNTKTHISEIDIKEYEIKINKSLNLEN